MLYYCENCLIINEQDCCQSCDKTHLRNPSKNDYCYLVEVDLMFGEMFKGILEAENIIYSAIPSGNGLRSCFALQLDNLKIFVIYEFFNRAKEILNEILADLEEKQNSNLKNNIDKLFASHRSEKKIKKIFKMTENDSLIEYCSHIILNADRIINKGDISSCIHGGDYLFVYKDNERFIINSATYEIISAEKSTKKNRNG